MFEKVWTWIKTHPIIVAGIIGVLVLFYLLSSSSSSASASSSGSSGPSDALLAAELQANTQQATVAAQAGVANNQTAAAVSVAQIQAGVQNYQTEQSANVAELGINAQKDIQTAGLQTQQIIALANDATSVQLQQSADAVRTAQINGVVAIANAPYAVQEAQLTALGPGGLTSIITRAEGVKNSYVSIGGITAGRNTPASNGAGIASGIASGFASLVGLL